MTEVFFILVGLVIAYIVYKTRSARGAKGAPWGIETGGRTVDHADVLAGKGLYPVDNIQAGDMIRHGYNTGHTTHNTTALGPSVSANDSFNPKVVEFPAAYGSHWASGVMQDSDYQMNPETDQAFRYLRNLPALQKELSSVQSLNNKYQEYLDKKTIAKLPIKEIKSIRTGPVKVPYIPKKEYPNTRRGRKQEKQDNAYIEAYMARMQKK